MLNFVGLAQQDPQFSQYMLNPNIWNPSYSAIKSQTSFCFHHRTQWLGYTNSDNNPSIAPPSTQLFTATTSFGKINSGAGINLLNDVIGPVKNQSLLLSYSYFRNLGNGKISAGIGLGTQVISVNTNLWRPEDPGDPTLSNAGSLSQYQPVLRLGLSYATDNLYVGIASNNLNTPSYSFDISNTFSRLERHYYIQAGYRFNLLENVALQPSAMLKSVRNITSLEVSNLALIHNFWFGLSYRTGDALIFLTGIDLLKDKSLKIGYNFDLTVINTKAKSASSHEIFLSYNLHSLLDNKKPVIRTPRFRF